MSVATALFIVTAALFMIAAHPFITYPLSLLALRRLRHTKPYAARGTSQSLDFTICMCAYNEENVIRQKLQNLMALKDRDPGLEILIYVDAASDDTARRLRAYAPYINFHVAKERHGKTYGMNLLAARAKGSILVFTDANVMLDMQCIQHLRHEFRDPGVGCVCGHLAYTNGAQSATAATGSLYWRLEEGIKSLEEQTGSVMGADGSLFAIRKDLHHPPPDHIIDDMYVSFMVLLDGYRIVQSNAVRCYEASATSSAEEFRRKARIACQAFNVHKIIWPRVRRLDSVTVYKYVSHKLLRWLSIYFFALGTLALLAALVVAGFVGAAGALVVSGALLAALGWLWSIKPFAQLVDIVISLAGAGLGVWKSLRGESYQTWTPAASIRKAIE